MLFDYINEVSGGSTTPAISYALGNAGFWMDFQVELLAPPVAIMVAPYVGA
jgi:hypothetical protein